MVGIVAASIAEVDDSVTVPQLRVLVMVDTRGPLNLAAVAAGLAVNPSNASRACDRLVGAGMIRRADAEHDRRNVSISLTEKGQRFVDSLMEARAELLSEAVADMTPADRRKLAQSLSAFLSSVENSGLGELLVTHTIPAWLR